MTNSAPTTPRRPRLRAAATVATATLAVGAFAGTPVALANDGDVRASGSCGSGTWKLKAHADDGRIEVEFEVDTNKVGQTWSVRLRDNGDLFFSGDRTTQAPSGSFEVDKGTADRAGADVIRARAIRGDRVCGGSVTV